MERNENGEKNKKRTTSISTDGGYRLVPQFNRKRTATKRGRGEEGGEK